jgi:Peptidoglycan-binding protein, CsiV
MMRFPTLVALCLSLLLAAPHARAEYQVEVVVFAHAAGDSDGEQWVEDAGLPDRGGYALLGAATEGGGPSVAPLPGASHRLNGVVAALRKSGRYRALFHASWMHPETGRVRGVFVSQPAPGAAAAEILGGVRIRVTRFLHADIDMAWFPPALADEVVQHVRLQESRKIKLNEVHYFDHPLFGVLLQVSRVGGEERETAAADGTGSTAPQ